MRLKIFSLFELNRALREVIEAGLPDEYPVIAEIASIRTDQKGHCYLELIERDENTIIARMSGTIWSYNYRIISRQFMSVTGLPLSKGMKILLNAGISFHERYGLSLNIQDIDPSYTLGEMAKKRQEILDRLTREDLINKNMELDFPILPLSIAVISSPGAAGYDDFMNHIKNNPYGYNFNTELFQAIMQGENAEASIIGAFEKCRERHYLFDLIVIIRGGGGEADLHCFDSYKIGKLIAEMPLPVISGIGHQRDRTVVDEVAHTSVKTPTAAAGLIIQAVREFHLRVREYETRLIRSSGEILENNRFKLHTLSAEMDKLVTRCLAMEDVKLNHMKQALSYCRKLLHYQREKIDRLRDMTHALVKNSTKENLFALDYLQDLIKKHFKSYMQNHKNLLTNRQTNIGHLNPANVLKRGYSITYRDNMLVKDIQNVSPGDIIKTVLYRGTIRSNITEVKEDGEEKTTDI